MIYEESKIINDAVGDTAFGKFIVEEFERQPDPPIMRYHPEFKDRLHEIFGVLCAYDRLFGNFSEDSNVPTKEKIEIAKKALEALEEFEKNK